MVNGSPELGLNGPKMLAIAYAPRLIRPRFRWLLMFDERLQALVNRTREPLIAQMRLAWWRDMLGKDPDQRPKGEPLLAELAALGGDLDRSAKQLVDACELRIAGQSDEAERERAQAICEAYAGWVGIDLHAIPLFGNGLDGAHDSLKPSAPRALRPLSILAFAARLEQGALSPGPFGAGLRLSWHALTGR
jgi:15-cis-phytoene synthase